jgi:hypothetical protein
MKLSVELSNVGNPDHRENPDRALSGIQTGWKTVDSVEAAQAAVRAYISENDLGGGNWSGGDVKNLETGDIIGSISYNGRFWPADEPSRSMKI